MFIKGAHAKMYLNCSLVYLLVVFVNVLQFLKRQSQITSCVHLSEGNETPKRIIQNVNEFPASFCEIPCNFKHQFTSFNLSACTSFKMNVFVLRSQATYLKWTK